MKEWQLLQQQQTSGPLSVRTSARWQKGLEEKENKTTLVPSQAQNLFGLSKMQEAC